jgi:hypothetical protein
VGEEVGEWGQRARRDSGKGGEADGFDARGVDADLREAKEARGFEQECGLPAVGLDQVDLPILRRGRQDETWEAGAAAEIRDGAMRGEERQELERILDVALVDRRGIALGDEVDAGVPEQQEVAQGGEPLLRFT